MKCRFPSSPLPGNRKITGVTNVILDHRRAAELSLRSFCTSWVIVTSFHARSVVQLGLRRSLAESGGGSQGTGIEIRPELTIKLGGI